MGEKPMTDPMELVGRLENGSDRFLKWAYKESYSGSPVISIPRHPDNIDALLTEAAACIRELVEWRDIETAPRDGTVLLLRTGHGRCIVGFWLNGSWDDGDFAAFDSEDVKFWLPLPPAPGAEA